MNPKITSALKNKHLALAVGTIVLFFVGTAIGYRYGRPADDGIEDDKPLRFQSGKLSHPLLECDIEGEDLPAAAQEIPYFDKDLTEFARNLEGRLGVSKVTVYFRDLGNGPWIGVKQDRQLLDPSKSRLPLFLALMKQGESDPAFLSRPLICDPSKLGLPDTNSTIYKSVMTAGEYTVGGVMERMLDFGDPLAAKLLEKLANQEIYAKVLRDLSIELDYDPSTKSLLSARSLSRFPLVIYNNSYLNHRTSEAAMSIMTGNAFTEAMPRFLPKEVLIAHNYEAVRTSTDPDEMWSVHDTGVVYYKGMPYALSILTTGQNPIAQTNAIAELSRFVFQKVDSHMKKMHRKS